MVHGDAEGRPALRMLWAALLTLPPIVPSIVLSGCASARTHGSGSGRCHTQLFQGDIGLSRGSGICLVQSQRALCMVSCRSNYCAFYL
jgi:uncharacterized protein YceK